MNLLTVWDNAQESIKEKIGKASYETWFASVHVRSAAPNTLIIDTPDEFYKNWFIEHYHLLIKDSLSQLTAGDVSIEYNVDSQARRAETPPILTPVDKNFVGTDKSLAKLNARFTFENFVIGSSNRFACAAALAVAEAPAKAYNPLFLYGPVGLGKTHLIQSITHKIRQLHPQLKHCYMTSEQFTNELINAIRHGATNQFRLKYREIDVLLIDDIQFIAGKESTQEEFFHTFNALHNNRKQIIITSDRQPKEIKNLEERLISRFAWGLITDVQPPDFETRVAILRKKIELEPVKVPDDVIIFIADQIKTNIRELEGALIRVVAYAVLEERTITLEMAKHILKDMVKETIKNININKIQKIVADFYHLPLSDLRSKRRQKNIVLPRQIAMYLSRQLTSLSLPEIGNSFGGKDHTTVLHSCKKIEQEFINSADIKNTINQLTILIQQ